MMSSVVLAFSVTLIVLLLLLRTGLKNFALDKPNHRSLHTQVIPRTGGLAVVCGSLAAWISADVPWLWIIPVVVLLAVSLVDDVRSLPVRWRLLAQLLVSTGISVTLLSGFPWWFQILMVLAITWMINLYNFMDGSDGLAGGMALFGFASYAVVAWGGGNLPIATLTASIVAASLAFLLFNFNPAQIFLGDSGSVPLGFLAGAVGLHGWHAGLWAGWFPLLVFSPFIVDASVTLLKRLVSREKVWQAHRSHYYQRLIQLGWNHRKTAIAEYCMMLAAGSSAIYLLNQPSWIVIIVVGIWLIIYLTIMILIDRVWRLKA